jgi:DNA primase
MAVIKPSCVRDLKLRVNIADVVARTVALKKAGARLKGLCPFHGEKTPSFNVDSDKGFYKCFGCGKAGDIISFVRETEQLTFSEAVETLGQRFGIVIEYEEGSGPTKEDRSLRQEIYDLHEQAADYYSELFKGTHSAGEYIRNYWVVTRKFPLELADEFKLGVTPADENALATRLWKRKYSEDALRQCGLFFVREGSLLTPGALRPRFRGRLMIPIRDHQGRVVAFTARQTELTPKDDPSFEAKYVNSPETPIFVKGQLLFNLDRARANVSDDKPFLMVEGQLDAMRCWQLGIKTAVAPQGTAITEGQLSLLRRYNPKIDCFFDSDSAGQKAALRLLPMALKTGMEVRYLGLTGSAKIDPDLLFLEKGLSAYDDLKKESLSGMAFACHAYNPEGQIVSAEEKSRAAQAVLEIIATAESEVSRSSFIAEAAGHLKISPEALQRDFDRLLKRGERQARKPISLAPTSLPTPPSTFDGSKTPEIELLSLCLHKEAMGKPISAALPPAWIDTTHIAGSLLNRFLAEFDQDNWPGRDHLDSLLETPEEKALIASLLFDTPMLENPVKIAQEGLKRLRARSLEPRLRQIELALASTPDESKDDAISLLKESFELHRELRKNIVLGVAD